MVGDLQFNWVLFISSFPNDIVFLFANFSFGAGKSNNTTKVVLIVVFSVVAALVVLFAMCICLRRRIMLRRLLGKFFFSCCIVVIRIQFKTNGLVFYIVELVL